MKFFKNIVKFSKLRSGDKIIFLEALYYSAKSRFMVKFIPFKKIAPILGDGREDLCVDDEKFIGEIKKISAAVNTVSRNTPWESKCLVQALTAKYMLKRRGIKSAVYFGVMKNDEKNIKAHAWIKSNNIILTGKAGMDNYKIISIFSDM